MKQKTYENFYFSRYDIDSMAIYVLAQTVNYLYTTVLCWLYFGTLYFVNVFYIEIQMFFSKKIGYIAKQIEAMNASKTNLVDNRKLSRLIMEYNRVIFELIKMNELFRVRRHLFKGIKPSRLLF